MPKTGSSRLRGIELLSDIGEKDLEALEKSCRWKQYAAHEQIIDRQSDTRDVIFVVRGKVRIVNFSLSGREITFDDLGEGSFFGELAALDGQLRSAGVMALTDTLVASLPPDLFVETLGRHPDLALKVMIHLAHVVRMATDRIMDLSTLAANNRIHADLLRQARVNMKEENTAIISPIPVHGDIASRVSTTRETVARVMNDLARQGIVKRTKDSLILFDVDRLQEIVEEVRGA
ncbi:MAG: Crp/Fnr family transcriptional regulator [Rhodospirillales bacterium]|nr:Crp/Fnr family transcriptional regulator [Rhodospirillales bacterium]MDP6884586.1 Crp/Fnr family transcriptional regulator [Rhodospirillales bacterium]